MRGNGRCDALLGRDLALGRIDSDLEGGFGVSAGQCSISFASSRTGTAPSSRRSGGTVS